MEHERLVEAYSVLDEKLQHSLSEQSVLETTIQELKVCNICRLGCVSTGLAFILWCTFVEVGPMQFVSQVELKRQERDRIIAQKETVDLQKQVCLEGDLMINIYC